MADDNNNNEEKKRIKVSNIAAPPTDPGSYSSGTGRATAEDIARAQKMGIDKSNLNSAMKNIKVLPNPSGVMSIPSSDNGNIATPLATQTAQSSVPSNAVIMKDSSQLRGSARNEAMGFPGDLEAIHGTVFTMGPRAGNDAEIEHSKRNQAIMDAFYKAQVPDSPTYEYRWNHIPGDVTGSGRNLTHHAGFDTLERVLINPGQTQAQASQAALQHIGQAMHGAGTLEGVAKTQADTNKTDMETSLMPEHEKNLGKYYDSLAAKGEKSDPFFDWLGGQPKEVQDEFYRGLGRIKTNNAQQEAFSNSPSANGIAKPPAPIDTSSNDNIEAMRAAEKRKKYIQDTLEGKYDRFQYEPPSSFAARAIGSIGSGIASLFRNPENDQWQ